MENAVFKSIIVAGLAVALQASPAAAQDGAPVYASKADIAAITAQALAAVRPGHGTSSRPVLTLGGYTEKLEYHTGPNIAAAHDQQAELFHALEGSGTLITGGTIVKTATSAIIVGGTARHVAVGDIFIVPEGMPHWFSQVDGHMVLVSVMLPRPATAGAK
jgi:mannose-6-phosphate isomerase-like protein (cupin superfamily)